MQVQAAAAAAGQAAAGVLFSQRLACPTQQGWRRAGAGAWLELDAEASATGVDGRGRAGMDVRAWTCGWVATEQLAGWHWRLGRVDSGF